MKKLILTLGVIMGLISLSNPSYALSYRDSTNKTFLQMPLGAGFYNNSNTNLGSQIGALVTIPGIPITGLSLSGGASGGTVSIYDTASPSGAFTPSECVYEATIGSNTQSYIDLSNAPINTQNGVAVIATSTSGVVIYNGSGTTNR